MSRYRFIEAQRGQHSVRLLCQVLGVPTSGCYSWQNAQAESLWSRLKTEVLEVRERPVFTDLADAQSSVADYFEYYNHERLHSSIDY